MFNNCIRNVQDWLLPPECLLCGARLHGRAHFCPGCTADLPRLTAACPGCALPGPGARLCGRCQRRRPRFDAALAAFSYDTPIDRLIIGLKFHGRLMHARALGGLLAERLAAPDAVRPDRLVPIPLHPRRLRSRGYNQALELARPVARRLKLPIDHRCLTRVRATPPQTGLDAAGRARNMRGAFAARGDLGGSHIALIDDVMTSGHTADAAAAALKRAGAAFVEVWVVARA
ncbi:MAG TPA: ComF family protein [Acidiferrobacterales bacterium]